MCCQWHTKATETNNILIIIATFKVSANNIELCFVNLIRTGSTVAAHTKHTIPNSTHLRSQIRDDDELLEDILGQNVRVASLFDVIR